MNILNKVDISVIICTFNRSQMLKGCLESMEELAVPEGLKWETLIVDNNSTDDTKEVIEEAKKGELNIKYVFEKKQGLATARNRGIGEAKGKIVAFIDDDVILDRNWLSRMYYFFKENPGIDYIGGKIEYIWPHNRQKWQIKSPFFKKNIYGNEPFALTKDSQVIAVGCNMAFRSKVFEKAGLFRPEMNILFEDGEMSHRLQDRGYKGMYVPDIRLKHIMLPERLDIGFQKNLHKKIGIALSRREYLHSKNPKKLPLFEPWRIKEIANSIFQMLVCLITRNESKEFYAELNIIMHINFIKERFRNVVLGKMND